MKRPSRISNNKKRKIRALIEEASRALGAGAADVCERVCQQIESMQEGNADVANIRGVIAVRSGQDDAAEKYFVEAINAAPKRVDFQLNLAKLYLSHGVNADAIQRYAAVLKLDGHNLEASLGYGQCLIRLEQYQAAYRFFKPMLHKYPKHPDVLMSMFRACFMLNKMDQARECLQTVLQYDPKHADALVQMGQIELQEGDFVAAEQSTRKALAVAPRLTGAYVALSNIKHYDDENDADIAAMKMLHEQSEPDSLDAVNLGFAIGKALDDCHCYDSAFEYFREANHIRHRHSQYNGDAELAHMQAIMDHYSKDVLASNSGIPDVTPIFVLGMPRSGTTLVEQILAAHPDVESRGECAWFEETLASLQDEDQPLTLEQITGFEPEQWRQTGQAYLDRLKRNAPSAIRITDKTLVNIRQIGAIYCALPHARIIHVKRNPLDTCLSIYKNNMVGSLIDYAYSLGQTGYYYRMYQRLMQHWRDILPAGVMYELDYEQLVLNQESETKALLDACNLSWNDACMQFRKADNMVYTASIAQVRRNMYKDSVHAWKHYEKHLQPLIKILGTS